MQDNSLQDLLDTGRETFNELAENQKENQDWRHKLAEIDNIADTNISCAISYTDSMLNLNSDDYQRKQLLWIKGELSYEINEISRAYDSFQMAENLEKKISPRDNINMASCLVLMDQEAESLDRIMKAIDVNEDHYWYLGNYYEILKDKEAAIEAYSVLAGSNKVYEYYSIRIDELENDSSFYSKFIFRYTRLNGGLVLVPMN